MMEPGELQRLVEILRALPPGEAEQLLQGRTVGEVVDARPKPGPAAETLPSSPNAEAAASASSPPAEAIRGNVERVSATAHLEGCQLGRGGGCTCGAVPVPRPAEPGRAKRAPRGRSGPAAHVETLSGVQAIFEREQARAAEMAPVTGLDQFARAAKLGWDFLTVGLDDDE